MLYLIASILSIVSSVVILLIGFLLGSATYLKYKKMNKYKRRVL